MQLGIWIRYFQKKINLGLSTGTSTSLQRGRYFCLSTSQPPPLLTEILFLMWWSKSANVLGVLGGVASEALDLTGFYYSGKPTVVKKKSIQLSRTSTARYLSYTYWLFFFLWLKLGIIFSLCKLQVSAGRLHSKIWEVFQGIYQWPQVIILLLMQPLKTEIQIIITIRRWRNIITATKIHSFKVEFYEPIASIAWIVQMLLNMRMV